MSVIMGVLELTKNNEVEQICRDALAQHAKLFRLWHKFRGGRSDRSQLNRRSIPIEKCLFALGERHLDSSNRDVRNLAAVMFEHIPRLFLFVEEEGVEPTNNGSEASWLPRAFSPLRRPVAFKDATSSPICPPRSPAIAVASSPLPSCPGRGYLSSVRLEVQQIQLVRK